MSKRMSTKRKSPDEEPKTIDNFLADFKEWKVPRFFLFPLVLCLEKSLQVRFPIFLITIIFSIKI